MRRRLVLSLLAAAACVAPLVAAAPSAQAHTRPSASLTAVHAKISAGNAPKFRYAVAHVSTTKVILQRQFGTQHVWKTVRETKVRSGTFTAPKLAQLGRYVYRVRGLYHGHVRVTSASRAVNAYGSISLLALCSSMTHNYYSWCGTRHEQVGTTIFTYSMRAYTYTYPSYRRIGSMSSTSCRSMSLRFVTSSPSRGIAYLELLQGASDPQYASAGKNTIGTFTARFDGGPFYLQAAANNSAHSVRMAGHASCYTVNGKK